jgi:hypothetical protein
MIAIILSESTQHQIANDSRAFMAGGDWCGRIAVDMTGTLRSAFENRSEWLEKPRNSDQGILSINSLENLESALGSHERLVQKKL